MLKNWTTLTRYLEDGSIDNDRTGRSLRGAVVGRRKWTFVGSDRWWQDDGRGAQLRGVVRISEGGPVRLLPGRAGR